MHEKLRHAESREGASFGTLFGPALCLGIISRRRVHYEAIKYEKERNGGFMSPFGYSAATVAAVADTVCSMEVVDICHRCIFLLVLTLIYGCLLSFGRYQMFKWNANLRLADYHGSGIGLWLQKVNLWIKEGTPYEYGDGKAF